MYSLTRARYFNLNAKLIKNGSCYNRNQWGLTDASTQYPSIDDEQWISTTFSNVY